MTQLRAEESVDDHGLALAVTAPVRVRSAGELEAFLDARELEWWPASRPGSVGVACRVGVSPADLGISLEGGLLHVQVVLPARPVPADARVSTAAVVCALNSGLALPGFHLDRETGDIAYRASVPLGSAGLEAEVLSALLATAVSTAEEHMGALLSVPGEEGGRATPARSGEPLYDTVRAYLARGGGDLSGRSHAPGSAPRPRGVAYGDEWDERGGALIWHGATGEVVGIARPEGVWSFEDGEWRRKSGLLPGPWPEDAGSCVASCRVADVTAALESRLRDLGFDDSYDEVVVERRLGAGLAPVDETLDLTRPDTPPLDLLSEAIQGSPNRSLQGLLAATLAERIDRASREACSVAGWRVAHQRGEPVALFHWDVQGNGLGSLGFLGVRPAWRGRGVGRAVHGLALRELARLGAHAYRDATDVMNRPMQSVFFWNACLAVERTRHFRPHGR